MTRLDRAISALVICALLFLGSQALPVSAKEDSRGPVTLLSAVSTDELSVEAPASFVDQCREQAIYIIWGSGTSAGVIEIESADVTGYAGTWAPLTTVSWTAASKQDIVQITGVHAVLRTRISTAISGGSVTTRIVCN